MMTQEELIKEIEQLPLERRREVLDVLSGKVEDNTSTREHRAAAFARLPGSLKPHSPAREEVISEAENGRGSLSQSLYGILRFESGPPTDAEVKDMIADYLLKKYY